ncbi:MAG: glycosyltransferase [Saprospiraceae bacterium]
MSPLSPHQPNHTIAQPSAKEQAPNHNLAPIVCHAFPAWDGDYLKSTVQLMRQLALRRKVLYVDYAYTWKDFFKSLTGRGHASWRRMLGLQNPLRKIELPDPKTTSQPVNQSTNQPIGSLHVLTLPPVLPTNFLRNPRLYDWANALNVKWLRGRIRTAMHTLGIEKPVVVNAFNPAFGLHLVGELGEKQLIYYCYDEIGAAKWAKNHGARLERQFIPKCDAVVVSSAGLLRRKSPLHPRTVLVKNGVDFDLFSREVAPADLPEIPGRTANQPVIGYLGSVDERLDYQLIESLARLLPKAMFVFVGRVQTSAESERIRLLPNVFFAGPKPPETLPAWVQTFDVCLIPFVKNELTAGIYPLKINEYLAAGKPVIATPFADLSDFEGIISVANDVDSFIRAIEKYILENAPRERARRVFFAGKNSWAARGTEFERVWAGEELEQNLQTEIIHLPHVKQAPAPAF